MASLPSDHSSPGGNGGAAGLSDQTRRLALSVVTALFFMWGFITCLNDILVPHLKAVFNLNYVESSLIQFAFFGAYFVMSLPSGKIVARAGYRWSMVIGLVTAGAGTLLFYPAAGLLSYPLFLGALFVLASGITLLQVAANPYISALGKPETASSRLNLAQAFNSLGTTIAPKLGGVLILAAAGTGTVAVTDKLAEAASVKIPYLILTDMLLLLAAIVSFVKLPTLWSVEEDAQHKGTLIDALKVPHLALGSIGIFVYVGAEVAIGSYLINFMGDPAVAALNPQVAAGYVAYYWGGAMVGRFVGSALLQKMEAGKLLGINAAIASALCIVGLTLNGDAAMCAVLAIGFFNSIMFPNIFTLGIRGLGHLTSHGSSLLIMAIVGGAIIPVIMGRMADLFGIHHSLFVPAICYLYIIYYGFFGSRLDERGVKTA